VRRFVDASAHSAWRWEAQGPVELVSMVPVVLAIAGVSHVWKNMVGGNIGGGPITVARGGTLGVAGNGQNETIVCNEGSLTLSANNSTVKVVGHCA
jgi:hypothetical protein